MTPMNPDAIHSFALFFSLLNPFLMSIYMLGIIRTSEAKTFNTALITGSLISFMVFLLFAWVVKRYLTSIYMCVLNLSRFLVA